MLVPILATGALLTAGCDTERDIQLAEREYNGPVTIRIVKEVNSAFGRKNINGLDSKRLEITDSLGNILATFSSLNSANDEMKLYDKDGNMYDTEAGGIELPKR